MWRVSLARSSSVFINQLLVFFLFLLFLAALSSFFFSLALSRAASVRQKGRQSGEFYAFQSADAGGLPVSSCTPKWRTTAAPGNERISRHNKSRV